MQQGQATAERAALLALLHTQPVPKRIRTLRQLHELSHETLAERIRGMTDLRTSRWSVGNWERGDRGASRGHRPVAKARAALAAIFDVPVETFD